MPPKRPIRNVFGNDYEETPPHDDANKRRRPDTARSTIHRIGIPPSTNNTPPAVSAASAASAASGGVASIQAQVAAAKARAQALMSALQSKNTLSQSNGPTSTPNIGGSNSAVGATSATNTAMSGGKDTSIQAQLEAARAKVQAQIALLNKNQSNPPSLTSTQPSKPTTIPPPTQCASKPPTAIHPLLLSNHHAYKPSDASSTKPTSSSWIKARTNGLVETNPYVQASRQAVVEAGNRPKHRSMHRGFQFHKPGRHIQQAEEARREGQMEELKRRIEESARKAGLSDELAGEENKLIRPSPPDVEWWDVGLLSRRSYEDVPDSLSVEEMMEMVEKGGGLEGVLLVGDNSPIDHYVQHPIPIPAPSDKLQVQPKRLMLTKTEQSKLRRQRRAAQQSDKRDRIKMGLLPPEPPKVKLSNLMRVLTSEAVSDPTKIEARVRREMAARKEMHQRQNAERKLTDEQRREKVERRKEWDEQKGLYCHVYRIKHLVSPRHKFKVRKNAQDHGLTGVCIFHPSMAVVVVEGSGKALKAYKRLMMVRIDWTDPGEPKQQEQDEEDAGGNPNNTAVGGGGFRMLSTSEEDVEWSKNSCELIFEGAIRERYWQQRGFRAIAAATDQAARDALGSNMQGYWDVAKHALQSQTDTL